MPYGSRITLAIKSHNEEVVFKIGPNCNIYKRDDGHRERADLEMEKLLELLENPKMVRLQLNFGIAINLQKVNMKWPQSTEKFTN